MLTKVHIRNFKRFDDIEVELGKAVVLIGPNNSGKTTLLQALTLWDLGIRHWLAKRGGKASPEKRPGVTINRRGLISIPVPSANLLWRDLHVRNVRNGGQSTAQTQNIRMDIIVDGIKEGKMWSCGLEFDYSNEESFICRPVREPGYAEVPVKSAKFTEVPSIVSDIKLALLPPMSGLAAVEPKWEPGRINVLLGEGQTAQVLRNLCFQIFQRENGRNDWDTLVRHIRTLFGVTLLPPEHIVERGEITMEYEEPNRTRLDLSSSGRGLQQTVLLLAHLYANPGTILLLDEPDAHLEILRQRQIYQLLTELADSQGSQIIAASHSEVVLNEAADRHIVVAFVGKPHRIDDRGSQVLKSLKEIGFDHYYLAEQRGWVLYLEGSTDLSMLRAFAKKLHHPAAELLDDVFVHYVLNQPMQVRHHFYGLREAKNDLVGVALFDAYGETPTDPNVRMLQWKKREIENYLADRELLLAYAFHHDPSDLFEEAMSATRRQAMIEAINEVSNALQTLGKDAFGPTIETSDEFFDPLFKRYFEKLKLPNLLRKSGYDVLTDFLNVERIDPEITAKLDAIKATADQAKPRSE